MAFRTWGKVLLTALGIGLAAGAGQLGIAYGLGVVRFDRVFAATMANQWPAQLVWVGWFALVATVAGTAVAHQLTHRYDLPDTTGTRLVTAVSATVGALVVAPLSMRPARTAEVAGVEPVSVVGTTALLGAVVGLVVAMATLHWRTVARNVTVFVGFGWLLALVSVLPSLGPTDPLPAVRLGVLDPGPLDYDTAQRLAVVLLPAVALVVGALLGALARRDGHPVPVVATAGLVGPATFTTVYLFAGAGDSTDGYQAAPYWGALIAVATGAIGSGLAAVLRWPVGATVASDGTETVDGTEPPAPNLDTPDEPTVPIARVDEPTTGIGTVDAPTATIVPVGGADAGADEPTAPIVSPSRPAREEEPTAPIVSPSRPTYRPGDRPLRVEDFWPTTEGGTAPAAPTPANPPAAPANPPAAPATPPAAPATTATPPTTATTTTSATSPAAPSTPTPVPEPPAAAPEPDGPEPTSATTPPPADPDRTVVLRASDQGGEKAPADRDARGGPGEDQDRVGSPGRVRRGLFRRNRSAQASASGQPAGSEQTAGSDQPTASGQPDRSEQPTASGQPAGSEQPTASGQPSASEPTGERASGPGVPGQRQPRRRGRSDQPVPARDEEYVDWVSGLSQPDPTERLDRGDGGRRTLRQPGRHHAD